MFRAVLSALGGSKKKIRIATKSIRCPELVRYVAGKLGEHAGGLMTFTAAETSFWAGEGERDLLLAYPTLAASDAELLARANRDGAAAAVVVDCEEHLAPLAEAARAQGTVVPLVVEIDLSFRRLRSRVVLGARRSPLRDPAAIVRFATKIGQTRGLKFHGIMGYESQIAGVDDVSFFARQMKLRSVSEVASARRNVARALDAARLPCTIFNGGGSGSISSASGEECLTELAAGSGFLDSHLFDGYENLELTPAIFFALQVVRRPAPDLVTCHGGGFVASGKSGSDRLPIPWLPSGLALTTLEGAGEVQTPIRVKNGAIALQLGEPIFFRHAKAGELAEHFDDYLLGRGDRVEARAKTYRGLGHTFLG